METYLPNSISSILEHDEDIEKSLYNLMIPGFCDGVYYYYDMEHNFFHGLFLRGDEVVDIYHSFININDDKYYLVNTNTKEMREYVSPTEYISSNQLQPMIIDLSFDGRRWEGPALGKIPWGFGCLYTNEDLLEYKGFLLGDLKICCGGEYHDDMDGALLYKGYFLDNQRNYFGMEFDRFQELEYEGPYHKGTSFLGSFTPIPKQYWSIQNSIELESVDSMMFIFRMVSKLEILPGACGKIDHLIIAYFPNLTILKIGYSSFTESVGWGETIWSNRQVSIKHNSSLTHITIGSFACQDCYRLTMTDLPALESLEIGNMSFYNASSLILKHFPHLRRVMLGRCAFYRSEKTVFSDLPELRSIKFDDKACVGKRTRECVMILRSLLNLQDFLFGDCSCYYVAELIVHNIAYNPLLSISKVGNKVLMNLKSITIDGKRRSRLPTLEQNNTSASNHNNCRDKSHSLGNEQHEQHEQRDESTSPSSSISSADLEDSSKRKEIDEDLNNIDNKQHEYLEVYDRASDQFKNRYEETKKFAELLRQSIC